jgi:hypothetical protein
LLLDQYPGAFSAYSLKRLRTDYAGASIRVRRSSDNTEQDIGFNGDVLDTAALSSFVGSASGFIRTIYDQSGNARHMQQSNTAVQPRIVNAGTTDLLSNGSPAILFNQNPWISWIGSVSIENSRFLSFQINTYIPNGGFMSMIPPQGQNDWGSVNGDIFGTQAPPVPVPIGFQFLFAAGALGDSTDQIINTSSVARNQVGLFRHANTQSFYWQGAYSANDSYSSGAGTAAGIGLGGRWAGTQSGFAPSSGNRGDFRLETLITYTTTQRSNAAAIIALM